MVTPPDRRILFLTGMHRSGTSFLAKRYRDAGLAFPGNLLPANEDNPEGYWEARECVSLNNEMLSSLGLDWKSIQPLDEAALARLIARYADRASECLLQLAGEAGAARFAVKDPRFCRLLPVWQAACEQTGLAPTLVATRRPAADVARSLFRRTRTERFRRAAIDVPGDAICLWLRYMLDLEAHSRAMPRRFVGFGDLRDPALLGRLLQADPPALPGDAINAGDAPDFETLCGAVMAALPLASLRGVRLAFDSWRRGFDQAIAREAARQDEMTGALAGAMRHSSGLLARPRPACPVIAFVSGEPSGRGHIYRVENRIGALCGGEAAVIRADPEADTPEDLVAASDIIIIFRRGMDAWQERLVSQASRRRIPVVFDIDDLIFDPDLVSPQIIHFLAQRGPDIIANWKEKARLYQYALEAASHAWVPTSSLMRQAGRFNPNAACLRNGLSDHQMRVSAKRTAGSPSTPIIGYASGTATHDEDFGQVVPALDELMSRHRALQLHIRGPLSDGALAPLMKYDGRVIRLPLVPYYELSGALGEIDINLAPLKPGNVFCECKSELKFFEAAIMGVPSVMSPTEPLEACAGNGDTGLLARETEDWCLALERLIKDRQGRVEMGLAARARAVREFGPDRQRQDFLNALKAILPDFRPTETATHGIINA